MTEEFHAKCPICGTANKVTSVYFEEHMGTMMRCYFCGKKFYVHHPNGTFKRQQGEVEAYLEK